MERQLRMGGGIMNLEPRQQYGLGSFVKKAVKGVTGAVKKIAGSDLGKAALGIGLGMYAGGLGPFASGARFGNLAGAGFLRNLPAITGEGGILKGITENFPGGGMGLATTVAGLTGFLSTQGKTEEEIAEIKQDPKVLGGYLEQYYRNLNPPTADTNSEEYEAQVSDFVQRNLKADGGRMGFEGGANKEYKFMELIDKEGEEEYYRKRAEELDRKYNPQNYNDIIPKEKPIQKYLLNEVMSERGMNTLSEDTRKMFMKELAVKAFKKGQISREEYNEIMGIEGKKANGGRIGYAFGNQPEQNAMQASGIGELPLNQNPAGITELDLRDSGGFIPPVGVKEKADDIPAMLSNNEFVFTADAVRGMGDGDVNVGAQRMYDMMKKLEGGGRV
jgi:hypothetical protein